MRLADFIRDNNAPIIREWETFAKTFVPAAEHMGPLALRNHIRQILAFIVEDMNSEQTDVEQVIKSHGEKPRAIYPSAAETHAALRHDGGFNMDQMVSEYRALRASVIKLWRAADGESLIDIKDLTRFNEAVDQALTESIQDYSHKLDVSRNLFLGILSHDLRNPLGAISMSAQLTLHIGDLDPKQLMLQSQILASCERASHIVTNLLDLTRSRLGSGLPIIREAMDLNFLSNQLVDEMRALHPSRKFLLNITGDVHGIWDKARLGQVFSTLPGNAVQYGFRGSPISVSVEGFDKEVVVSVHNDGVPISRSAIGTLFNSLTRAEYTDVDEARPPSLNLGLGLFISKEIVTAHGGIIGVTSTERGGTTFTMHIPRASEVVNLPANQARPA